MKRVIFQQADLDTCLTALILGVDRNDLVEVRYEEASVDELNDPDIFCIEAGGSGQWRLNNFDHHDPERYFPPACRQAFAAVGGSLALARLTEYVAFTDEALPPVTVPFPNLGHLFSGMRLCLEQPVDLFFAGIEMLQLLVREELDPYAPLPYRKEWAGYLDAKCRDMEKVAALVRQARFLKSRAGTSVGYIPVPLGDTGCQGGLFELYDQGCQVGILYHPQFGVPPIRKFTIGGNHFPVVRILDYFATKDPGWGGRETIIGSPRRGTLVSEDEVLSAVLDLL